jgi:sugar/nucleoside kinase (ribokinase family)
LRLLVTCAGILVVDFIAADLPKVSNPGELTFARKGIEMHVGGHVANVSIDLMKLGVEQGEVSCIGSVGEDIFGDFLESELKKYWIVTHLQRKQNVGTAKTIVLIVTGEDRRFHHDTAANWFLEPRFVTSTLEKEHPVIFYLGGVGLTGKLDKKLTKVLQKARNQGCLTFVDPVSPYLHEWDFIIPALKWMKYFTAI